MGKSIANTATSYRFIAGLGILGLVAALAIAQTKTGQLPNPTFPGINLQRFTPFISSGQAGSLTSFGSQTAAAVIPSPTVSALPVTSGFNNPFTGKTLPTDLAETISISINGQSVSGGGTPSTGIPSQTMAAQPITNGFTNPFTGFALPTDLAQSISISAGSGVTSSGVVAGTAGSALGGSGAGSSGGGFTVLPSLTSLPSGGSSLSGGANSGIAGSAGSVKGSFCGGYGI
jgi:hypothetical protein